MHFWDFHTHQSGQPYSLYQADNPATSGVGACSVGIHPWSVGLDWEDEFKRIQDQSSQHERVMAIGEAGVDRLKGPEISLQQSAFYTQASWAATLGIPLILHCVKSHDLLLEYLKSAKNPPCIIWHGWNQKPELATQLLPFPLFFSFGKHILHPGSNASKWLATCPLDRVFFETDDSGLEIGLIYQRASLLLQIPVASLAAQVIANWNAISKRKIS